MTLFHPNFCGLCYDRMGYCNVDMSDGQNHFARHVIALRGAQIALLFSGTAGPMCLNVQTNVIALGGAHIAFHGLLMFATTRVLRSNGLDKQNVGRRSYDCTVVLATLMMMLMLLMAMMTRMMMLVVMAMLMVTAMVLRMTV